MRLEGWTSGVNIVEPSNLGGRVKVSAVLQARL